MRLGLITVLVDDYDEAIAFFTDAVGMELIEDSPSTADDGSPKRWVVVRPAGAETGLLLAKPSTSDQSGALGRQVGERVGLFLETDDFAAQHERMVAAGVEFLEEPRLEPYGWVAVWRDVWGNRWDLLGPGTV